MSSPYLEETFHPFLERGVVDPAITWVTEREPLGTGGAIVSVLDRLGDEPFFALNGDILTDLDLTAMLARHRSSGAAVTIALHHVEDARAFGLVGDGRRRPRHRVPRETARSDPGGHQRGDLRPRPRRPPGVERRDVHLDRGRDLPPPDRGRGTGRSGSPPTRTGWTSGRRSSTCGRTSTCSTGRSRVVLRRAVGRPGRVGGPLGACREVRGGRGRGAGSRPAPRSIETVLLPGSVVEEGARVLRSIVGPRANGGCGRVPRRMRARRRRRGRARECISTGCGWARDSAP